ncbi:terminase small subunit [Arthrobacter phage MargaretKali]|uniref:Terminase small subunit n=1 Tax=Arthrobacter phage MargaretKali TaxID=2250414 RepID=A0A345KN51_9CAUD|nr:terminase small subunit [Arthrobacter phage MargaretKali]AXH44453.1 hypothetical protein SEA_MARGARETKALI_2 [Arthrobacter phage MargaretKali]
MATRKLRAVQEGDAPAKKPTVDEAAESGDHLQLLVAMRERIAVTVADPSCPPRDLAALTRRLQDISKEIEVTKQRSKQEAEENAEPAADEAWDAEAI